MRRYSAVNWAILQSKQVITLCLLSSALRTLFVRAKQLLYRALPVQSLCSFRLLKTLAFYLNEKHSGRLGTPLTVCDVPVTQFLKGT